MKKFSRYLSLLTPLSVGLLSASCQQTAKSELVINTNKQFDLNPYSFDYSTFTESTANQNDPLENLGAGKLFRLQTISNPQYNQDSSISQSGLVRYKFELAKSITLVLDDDTTMIFDNDDYEKIKVNESAYFFVKSSNNKSINSELFWSLMNNKHERKIKKMQIAIKDNVYWFNADNKQTQYKVVAEDFWYSFLRSYLQGTFQRKYRGWNGSFEESDLRDKHIKNKNGDIAGARFSSLLFTNTQQFEINGLSSSKFLEFDKNYAPVNAIQNNALVFETDDFNNEALNFGSFMNLMLTRSNIFAAAPSQYINELNKNLIADNITTSSGKVIDTNGEGIVKKVGLYFYGTNGWKNNLYAGSYIPNAKESTSNKLVWNLNEAYDKKASKAIKKIVINTQNFNSDAEFNNFKNGQNVILNYSNLSESQKQYLNANNQKYNIVLYKNYIKNRTITNNAFNITPAPALAVKNNADEYSFITNKYEEYAFNNNYAKLVYGSTIDEINKGFRGEINNPKSISSGVFENYSIAFRNYLNSSINWEYLKDKLYSNKELWISDVAPDALIGGNNQTSSQYKTLREAKDEINQTILIDHNGEKLTLDKNQNYKLTYKSETFDSIKTKVNELLNDFYQANSIDSQEKITWYIYNNRIWNLEEKNAMKEIIANIKSLDSRLNPILVIYETQNEIDQRLGKSNGEGDNNISQYSMFNYEYDTLSPYLDKITHSIGMSPFALWYKFANLNAEDKLVKTFPQMYSFSTAMKKDFENGQLILNEKLNLVDGTYNKIVWNDWDKFNSYEERNLYLHGKLIQQNDAYGYQFNSLGGIGYKWESDRGEFSIDNITEMSKFAKKYVATHTNEDLIQLVKELNTWRISNINLDKHIDSTNVVDYKISNKKLNIIIPIYNDVFIQDYEIK